MVIKMAEGKDNYVNKLSEEELELKRFAEKGNKLKWTWIIGIPVIILCIMDGDPAQLLLAIFVVIYIFITTIDYFKQISSEIS